MRHLSFSAEKKAKESKNALCIHIFTPNHWMFHKKSLFLLSKCQYYKRNRTTLIIKDMDKLDKLDKKILSILSQNARIPFKDVAAECNVSRAAIHQRVQHMREDGVITGSGFDVNPKSIGYTTCTYVGITLERGSMYKSVVERLVHISEIVECHFTTGPYTMLVKLFARDNEQLMDLLNNQLQGIPGVVATETLISLEQSIKREIPVITDDND